jgi:hypothetical protein
MAGEQPDPRLQGLVSEALAELKKKSLEHEAKCGFLKVDFLALKRFIENFVTEQEQRVYKGQPEVSLDSLVLTSEFQIIFDATAGTQHLLRILPVLQPPVLGLAPDHTHSLKLTFAGARPVEQRRVT